MSRSDLRFCLFFFVLGLTFCGDPDLHDIALEKLRGDTPECAPVDAVREPTE